MYLSVLTTHIKIKDSESFQKIFYLKLMAEDFCFNLLDVENCSIYIYASEEYVNVKING